MAINPSSGGRLVENYRVAFGFAALLFDIFHVKFYDTGRVKVINVKVKIV